MQMLNFLESFAEDIFYVFVAVEIMQILLEEFIIQSAPKLFWRPWRLLGLLRGSLGSLLFSAGLGTFLHRFGRCPHHGDFLEQFISQSAPKLVLMTLAPLRPPCGDHL